MERKSLDELKMKIGVWAINRGVDKLDPRDQMIKLMEEVGELANGFTKSNEEDRNDAIGDIFAVLVILSLQLGVSLTDCAHDSYEVFKDRTGQIINGTYVKSEDLNQN